MKILMISGTYNHHSKTWLMLKEAQKHCQSCGIDTEIAELCDYAITAGQKDTAHELRMLFTNRVVAGWSGLDAPFAG